MPNHWELSETGKWQARNPRRDESVPKEPAATGIARLVELEEERSKREKKKESSEGWNALCNLLIFVGVVWLVWANWPAIKAWLVLIGLFS